VHVADLVTDNYSCQEWFFCRNVRRSRQ
jgi:hypothetical protein